MGLPLKFLWQNYRDALIKADMLLYLQNSVKVTLAVIVISGILASMAASASTSSDHKKHGPYWDQIDRFARNQTAEAQFLNVDE